MEKDFIDIRVNNSYGDTFERHIEEPTCDELINEFVTIAQQLGYPLSCIYHFLLEESERVKQTIKISYDSVFTE